MRLRYQKRFDKRLQKLSSRLQDKVESTIQRFLHNPHDPRLRNHALRGDMQGRRAISVTGDVRIVFREENNYEIVFMLDVGTHNQVY